MKLSIVVAASNDLAALESCLESLRKQAESEDTEVLAVCNFNHNTEKELRSRFPFVRCVTFPNETTVPELRTAGIRLSSGDIVALVEDYCILDREWCAAIKAAHDDGAVAIGGAVENGSPDKLLNWAVYFVDYGQYMLPAQSRFVTALSGMNVSYRRKTLSELENAFQGGFYEASIHEELLRRGYKLYFLPTAIAYLTKDYRFFETLGNFYHHGRSFAGKRLVHRTALTRSFLALGSVLLPTLLCLRIARRNIAKRKHLTKMVLAVPLLLILTTAWSAGELVGYLWGEGASPRKWT